ncbi:MAG: YggS family pyridoxal phosphate-dependent enzyme [Bacteroidales bacterium]
MSQITNKIKELHETLPAHVRLVAVSKFHPQSAILEAYEAGQRIFGENKVQELTAKAESLPKDIEWHFIGHLQTNKVKYIAPFVSLIHSVDSLRLLSEINKYAEKNDRVIDCLIQIYIATEETKFGLDIDECRTIFSDELFLQMRNIRIVGVMGMATFCEDETQIRQEFRTLKSMFDTLKQEFFAEQSYFKEMSIGMSDDYPIAIEEGSTLVRIGSSIFGIRNY